MFHNIQYNHGVQSIVLFRFKHADIFNHKKKTYKLLSHLSYHFSFFSRFVPSMQTFSITKKQHKLQIFKPLTTFSFFLFFSFLLFLSCMNHHHQPFYLLPPHGVTLLMITTQQQQKTRWSWMNEPTIQQPKTNFLCAAPYYSYISSHHYHHHHHHHHKTHFILFYFN